MVSNKSCLETPKKQNMDYNLSLHPDLIDDMIEELFEIDIISQDQIKKLKCYDKPTHVDPNILMEVRHKEVKKESLVDISNEKSIQDETKVKKVNIHQDPSIKVKDLKTIDKEISNTRKCLEDFKKKLEQKNEDLQHSILDLEKEEKNNGFDECSDKKEHYYSSVVEKLNREENVKFFNLHLDCLEDAIQKSHPVDSVEAWIPVEVKSPVVNVTTFSEYDVIQGLLDDTEEVQKDLQMYELQTDYSSEKLTIGPHSNYILNSSPTFNVSITLDDNKLSSKQRETIQKAVRTWKLYVKKIKIQKWYNLKASKIKINLLKKYVSLWIFYTKQSKHRKETCLTTTSDTLEIVPTKCCFNQKRFGNLYKTESEVHQEQIKINEVKTKPVIKAKKNETVSKKVVISSKERNQASKSNRLENSSDKIEIHVKTFTPQDVGLAQQSNSVSQGCKKPSTNRDHETKNLTFRSMGEPIIHRFEAQEKIIKQQREVIEKQNRIIFDLQAKCLEIESKLNWTLAERQLAEAENCNKIVSKHLAITDRKQECNSDSKYSKSKVEEMLNTNSKTQNKSDKIVKNMLERQAYCSQLAEQTKQRKKRIEEEKERLKLELEEKQNKDKEEERKNRIMQKKLEQEIAREKERNAVALKKKEEELLDKALNHYTYKLKHNTFIIMKSKHLELLAKYEYSDRFYKHKVVQKMFHIWKDKTKHSIQRKNEFAEHYYNDKILKLAWNVLRKLHLDYKRRLQVSEDLYNLKLQERMFHRWQTFAAQQFLQACCKIELAERLHQRHLLRHYFRYWRELPRLMFKEREKEQRRRRWRETVQQLIPDFTPAYVD